MVRTIRLVHVVSLRMVGGVERNFCDFINCPVPNVTYRHFLLTPRPQVSNAVKPYLQQGLEGSRCLKKLGPIHVPRRPSVLRRSNLHRFLRKTSADALLLWNSPTTIPPDWFPQSVPVFYFERGASWYKRDRELMRRALARFTAVICNSFAGKRIIELKWGQDLSSKIHVSLNGVRPSVLRPVDRTSIDEDRGSWLIGTAGRMVPVKGLVLVLHALTILKKRGFPVRLLVAGTGQEKGKLEETATRLGIQSNTRFLGFVHHMDEFFGPIRLFLCPSLREPFGSICIEAQAHGVPVMATRVDGLPEVVQDGRTGICIDPDTPAREYPRYGGSLVGLPKEVYNPRRDCLMTPRFVSPERLAHHIEAALMSKDGLSEMSYAARRIARERFDFRRNVQEITDTILDYI